MPDFEKDEEWQLPEPNKIMTANNYKEKKVKPFFDKMKSALKQVVKKYLELQDKYRDTYNDYLNSKGREDFLQRQLEMTNNENNMLREVDKKYNIVKKVIGDEKIDNILKADKEKRHKSKETVFDFEC